jgi:hypothetical protein
MTSPPRMYEVIVGNLLIILPARFLFNHRNGINMRQIEEHQRERILEYEINKR